MSEERMTPEMIELLASFARKGSGVNTLAEVWPTPHVKARALAAGWLVPFPNEGGPALHRITRAGREALHRAQARGATQAKGTVCPSEYLVALLLTLSRADATASNWPTLRQGRNWMNHAIREGLATMLVGSAGPVLAITIKGRTTLRQWLETQTGTRMKETAKETGKETPMETDMYMTSNMIAFLTALRKSDAYYSTWNKIAPEHDLWNRAIRLGWVYLKSDGSDLAFVITPEGRAALEKVSPSLRKGDIYDPAPGTCIEEACREAVRRAPCVLHFNRYYLPCEKGMTAEGLVALWDNKRGAIAPALADAVFHGDKLVRITDLGNGWNDMPPMWRIGPHENKYDNLAHNGYSLEVVDIVRKTTC